MSDQLNVTNFGDDRKQLVLLYMAVTKKTTMSAAFRHLFDTHPEIVRVRDLFFGGDGREMAQVRELSEPESAP